MSIYFLSWYELPHGEPGTKQTGLESWTTGFRLIDSAKTLVARVEAPSATAAWAKLERAYPGCTKHQRFEEEHDDDWWPDAKAYPRAMA